MTQYKAGHNFIHTLARGLRMTDLTSALKTRRCLDQATKSDFGTLCYIPPGRRKYVRPESSSPPSTRSPTRSDVERCQTDLSNLKRTCLTLALAWVLLVCS